MAKKKKAEFDAEPPEEQSADLTAAQEAVAAAKASVAATEAQLVEDKLALAEAEAEVKELTQGPPAEYGKHILIEGAGGEHSKMDAPQGWEQERPYRILLNGQTLDHIGEDANGVWIYRRH